MIKNSIDKLETTDTFQTCFDKFNQVVKLANNSFITTGIGLETRGNVRISGEYTATNFLVDSTDGIMEADNISSYSLDDVVFNSPIIVSPTNVKNVATFKNTNGPVLKFTATTVNWKMGFDNSANNEFSFKRNDVKVFSIDSDGMLSANSATFTDPISASFFVGNATGNADTFTNGVYVLGNQTIRGTKTFTENVDAPLFRGSLTGTANTATNAVYILGNQTINGTKTFSSPVTITQNLFTTSLPVKALRAINTGTGLQGGGNLTSDRTISLAGQAESLHNISNNGALTRVSLAVMAARSLIAGSGISIVNPLGVEGNPKISPIFSTTEEILVGTSTTSVINPQNVASFKENIKGDKWLTHFGLNLPMSGIAYGQGQYVACLSGTGADRIVTSPNGIVWKQRTTPNTNSHESIIFANGLFVAVASTGTNRVMTSTDGFTWTARTTPSQTWNSIAYGNGLFVAVASTGTNTRVMTSPDAITWTTRVNSVNNNWQSIAFGNGIFVAVANSGTLNRVMTSTNGITWTTRTSAGDIDWRSVTFGNGLFVAVASSGVGNRVMTSTNGITWTIRTSAADNAWKSVTYGNGLFIAVADSGTGNRIMTSPNGITWTLRTSPIDSGWKGIIYADGKFVAVANASPPSPYSAEFRVMTSIV